MLDNKRNDRQKTFEIHALERDVSEEFRERSSYAEQINRILFAIAEAVNSTEDLRELYRTIHLILKSIIDVTNFFIAIVDRSKRTLYFPYHVDTVDEDFSPLADFDTESSLTGLVVAEKKPILLRTEELRKRDARNGVWGPSPLIWMGCPLIIREEVIGVVAVQNYTYDDIYDESDLQLLTTVSQQIAVAIDRKRFLDKLKESEERLNFLVKNSSDSLVIINADGSQRYVSPAAERITGFPVAELEGKTIHTLIHPDDMQDVMAAWNEAVEHPKKTVTVQYRHIHKTREWVFSEANAQSFLAEPAINGVIASVRDITERKRAEDALRESEDTFRLMFNSNPDAVNITRLDNDLFVDINEGFTRGTGFTRDEVIGKTSGELNIWHDPQDREQLVQRLREKGFFENLEAQFRKKDGSLITGLISTRVISLKGVPHIISITRDITERKKHENEQLKIEKLESLGILAGGIAHDFNNILTGIMGNISFAKIFLDATHKSYTPLSAAENAAVRAGELAHQLLTFARGGQPVKKVVSPLHLINEALSLVLHGSNVKATVDISDSIHAFEADEGQISQVFHNIIINATQAMPGGGMLTIAAQNKTLDRTNTLSLSPGAYIRLTITDQGCGISDDDLKRIFDPYFTTKSAGNGLGLASVYSIISRHGGHIGASSIIGKGTTFTIYLPSIGELYTQYQTDIATQTTGEHKGGTILVMDDDAMIRDIASSMLTHLGYEVTTCNSGEEAVNLYKASMEFGTPFLTVIMDLTIPGGLGGKQAAEQILSIYPKACLIVSSGYSNDPIMSNYQEYGFSGVIAKPYNIHEFEQVLASLAAS